MAGLTDGGEELLRDGLDKVPEAARFLGISRSQIYALMERGELSYVRIGRSRRIPHRAAIELAKRGLVVRS